MSAETDGSSERSNKTMIEIRSRLSTYGPMGGESAFWGGFGGEEVHDSLCRTSSSLLQHGANLPAGWMCPRSKWDCGASRLRSLKRVCQRLCRRRRTRFATKTATVWARTNAIRSGLLHGRRMVLASSGRRAPIASISFHRTEISICRCRRMSRFVGAIFTTGVPTVNEQRLTGTDSSRRRSPAPPVVATSFTSCKIRPKSPPRHEGANP